MTTAVKFWDGVAAKYARSPIKDMASYEQTLERTASYLKKTDDVLELGCGTGMTALRLSEFAESITATDVSQAMLEVGRKHAAQQDVTNVTFVQAAANTPPTGPFDVALAFNLLHLLEDLEGGLRQINSALKPGGLFISKTFCAPSRGASLRFRAIRLVLPVMQFLGKAPYVRFLSQPELDRVVQQAGFELVEQDRFPANDARRFLVARKI
ncbi:Ubiquinone/menaquinone biosynthesis C-methylase UbiE [Ruegeria halocynthiae]|uniref:Ubiquinone/menaquinone biosynthesis C-methylase UbiE n=1 Tax=Ruegeria halocynthiae TaxID=985054 RepID=A0A1H2ZG77_9RHOB|nr:class I SAM-dependent methyltransferase [Ruegeria halocynthiae]SDX16493.1 Ubiquinone/menaquinone biosynthesis C-methylase UbiE [Ruegeria halocynthiae]